MTVEDSETILFYHNPRSRAQMVHWMLEEVGAPYEILPIEFGQGEHKTPEFLALNPMGKLPTIVHRGTVVTETGAIIAYLADAFREAGLAPALDDPRRGTWLRWMFFAGTCFEPALLDTMLKRPPAEPKTIVGYGSYEDVLKALETMLDPGPYILGEEFSAADVYVGAEISWAMSFGAPGLKGNPLFDAYVARITDRPAYRRSIGADAAA
ncbi:glutathione S-transferase [Sphingomonas oleivorans]|uniref:Glutathione S-transferase n=1 Tax=Sphingomonas oleivorans TaxID=1735121 RepID=A0A2T5G035_9SPHN|nr:glutathione S-transferase family protein [Sphingomonas oleivorans]PTQ12310.1 glutathione S-transferase [Sphingomonas oleivorans]